MRIKGAGRSGVLACGGYLRVGAEPVLFFYSPSGRQDAGTLAPMLAQIVHCDL